MAAERHLVMAEVTDPFGHVESEPLVVSVDEQGWARLELEDGTVWRCLFSELVAAGEQKRRAA